MIRAIENGSFREFGLMKTGSQWPTTQVTLLHKLRNADDQLAWRRFVDLYSPLIYGYSRRRGLQDADAWNVAQDVMSRVVRAIGTFEYDPDRGRFRSWLGVMTFRRIQRLLHRESPAVCGLGGGAGDALSSQIAYEVDGTWIEEFNAHVYRCAREQIRSEFDALTWQVFEEVWEQGQCPAAVARRLQRRADWIYQAKFKVLQRMKQEVERLGADGLLMARSP
jgi:RNA polymerase sigma-70 factor, ECF subfamily